MTTEMKKKVGGDACSALNCSTSRAKNPELSFFRFPNPKDQERIAKWRINCRRKDLDDKTDQELYKGYQFCEKHFEISQFKSALASRKRLNWNAIPTLFDIPKYLKPKPITSKRKPPAIRNSNIVNKSKQVTRPGEIPSQNNPVPIANRNEEIEITDNVESESNILPENHDTGKKTANCKDAAKIARMEKIIKKLRCQNNRLKKQNLTFKLKLNSKKAKIPTIPNLIEGMSQYLKGTDLEFFKCQFK